LKYYRTKTRLISHVFAFLAIPPAKARKLVGSIRCRGVRVNQPRELAHANGGQCRRELKDRETLTWLRKVERTVGVTAMPTVAVFMFAVAAARQEPAFLGV
jgi:hypothetical protein